MVIFHKVADCARSVIFHKVRHRVRQIGVFYKLCTRANNSPTCSNYPASPFLAPASSADARFLYRLPLLLVVPSFSCVAGFTLSVVRCLLPLYFEFFLCCVVELSARKHNMMVPNQTELPCAEKKYNRAATRAHVNLFAVTP